MLFEQQSRKIFFKYEYQCPESHERARCPLSQLFSKREAMHRVFEFDCECHLTASAIETSSEETLWTFSSVKTFSNISEILRPC